LKRPTGVAVFYTQIGMLDRSEKEFRSILRKERHVPSLVNLGNVMYINDKLDEALALYKEAYELKPDNSKILFRTINLLYNRSEYEEAENLMARLQNQDPEMAATLASRYGGSGTTRASEANTFSLDDWAEE
jgi:tetratricopeptide (TPR) repeat protein